MEVKILYGAGMFLLGWLWFYLLGRQFLFNIFTAYPLIKKMNSLQDELIAIGAKRYTTISLIITGAVCAIVIALVIALCKTYLMISFFTGAAVALIMCANKLSPEFKPMFDTFCTGYYRFVPDDELRTAMYNKKFGQIKSRLKAMGIEGTFIPEFKK